MHHPSDEPQTAKRAQARHGIKKNFVDDFTFLPHNCMVRKKEKEAHDLL